MNKFFPAEDVSIEGYVPVKTIPVFLNNVFHELGYNTIEVNEQQAHQIFEIIDQNDDKVVTRDEITRGLMRILNTHGNLDKSGHSSLGYTNITNQSQNQTEEMQLTYLFDKYDNNKSGYLDLDEIVGFVNDYMRLLGKSCHFNVKQNEILMNWLDTDHDRKISKEEIWKMYTTHLIEYS